MRRIYETITEKSGYDLHPAASWMLLRIKRHGVVEPALLADTTPVPLTVVGDASQQIEERGLARRDGVGLVLTEHGLEVAEVLARAREQSLAELLGDWWGRTGRPI